MPEYRVFQIKTGHVDGPSVVIEVPTDQEAIVKATEMVNGADIELWQAGRLVTKIKSKA